MYLGYLPRKSSERRALLQSVVALPYTLIFLETPHRLLDALDDLLSVLGDRQMAAARELTKLHEEIVRGSLSQVQAHFMAGEPRGEFTLVIGGLPHIDARERWTDEQLLEAIQIGVAAGKPAKELSSQLVKPSGWPKREIYNLINKVR